MKRITNKLMLFVLMSMVGAKSYAHDIAVANDDSVAIYYTWVNNQTELSVSFRGSYATSYSDEYSGNVNIPSSVTYNGKTYSVTSIGKSAFDGCSSLASVDIPSSVTSIESLAFRGCSSLASVDIPSSVTKIGDSAFSGCSSLASVDIPSSVTSIEYQTFYNCSGLASVTIPSSVTKLGGSAFKDCSSLASVVIPSSVTSIVSDAFYNCNGLTSVQLNCKEVGSWFEGNKSIKEVVLGDSVTSIVSSAFRGCSGLTSLTITGSVTSIGGSAFYGCSSLTSVDIPSSVTSIESQTFYGCSGLTSVTIPSSVTSIGSEAFRGCSNLTTVTIPSGVTSIGNSAFYGCSSLASVTIPSSVTSMGYSAFSGCSSLASVTIPSGVTSIGGSAFYGCSSLTSVDIPSSVTSIESQTFYGCSGLTSVTIPSSVTSIGSYAFSGCSGLTSVTIPSSVTTLGSSAFQNCSGLTTVELHCKSVGTCFNGSQAIENIIIGDEVTYIYSQAFNETVLYNKAPYGVFYIGNWALGYKGTVNSGTEINIKEGTANLAGYSLNNKNISSVILPSTMKYICSNAFNSAIGTITITSDSIVQIGNHSFTSSNRLFVPTGTKSAYQNEDYWKNCTIYENTDVSQTENAVYIAPADVRLGQEPVVEICLKNAEDAAAYSFDVQFNGSVVIDEDELSERHTNHTRTFTNRGNGKYSFAVLSSTSDNLSGNDGAVRRVRLRFTSDTPAIVPVTISNAVYSRPDGTSVKMGNVDTTINVHDFAKGDVNGDGEVDIADAVCVVKHVVGDNSVIFKERPADVNEDNGVDIADAVSIVNMIIGKKSAAMLPAAKLSMREPQ